ncbi:MAG: vitamin K epoxide reductase family protein [Bdellovibrionaceae bacterium]|nr:vitamin K epoxide reductase family protein [Pseudobdellovibrionaceae bacterium]
MPLAIAVIFIFSLIGILDTIYISYHAYKNTDVWCPIFPKEWCLKVQYSKWSKTFGIPNGYLGFLLYSLIFVLTWLFHYQAAVPFWWIQVLSAFGFGFAVYFTIIQAFVLRAFCLWCIISAIDLSAILIAVFFL